MGTLYFIFNYYYSIFLQNIFKKNAVDQRLLCLFLNELVASEEA